MKKLISLPVLFSCLLLHPINLNAQERIVIGGQTSVLLNADTLTAAGLSISSVSGDVIAPGELGDGSVAFGINSRNGDLPTTFAYTAGTLAPFFGTIEHAGSVFFNDDSIQVGNFTIGFDGSRTAGGGADEASGFFVRSTAGVEEILFDIGNPTSLVADPTVLTIAANLLVSPEFAGILGNSAFAGANGGQALVSATAIPEPGIALLWSSVFLGLAVRRRKA